MTLVNNYVLHKIQSKLSMHIYIYILLIHVRLNNIAILAFKWKANIHKPGKPILRTKLQRFTTNYRLLGKIQTIWHPQKFQCPATHLILDQVRLGQARFVSLFGAPLRLEFEIQPLEKRRFCPYTGCFFYKIRNQLLPGLYIYIYAKFALCIYMS